MSSFKEALDEKPGYNKAENMELRFKDSAGLLCKEGGR
jgi:hypothetical protein